jgi:hypothetical protein
MTTPSSSRTLTCASCGTAFGCTLDGACWCAEESFRLPLPTEAAQDCLCPSCLRRIAAQQAATLPPVRAS